MEQLDQDRDINEAEVSTKSQKSGQRIGDSEMLPSSKTGDGNLGTDPCQNPGSQSIRDEETGGGPKAGRSLLSNPYANEGSSGEFK